MLVRCSVYDGQEPTVLPRVATVYLVTCVGCTNLQIFLDKLQICYTVCMVCRSHGVRNNNLAYIKKETISTMGIHMVQFKIPIQGLQQLSFGLGCSSKVHMQYTVQYSKYSTPSCGRLRRNEFESQKILPILNPLTTTGWNSDQLT